MVITKKCASCGQVLKLTKFYYRYPKGKRDPDKPSHRSGYCTVCCKKVSSAHYQKMKDTPEYRETRRKIDAKQREDPIKRKKIECRLQTNKALAAGEIARGPCEWEMPDGSKCGNPDTVFHHDDYDKPLDFKNFCGPHHYLHHKLEKAVTI